MVELMLKLLSDEQLLSLFEKVTRERSIVRWPPDPEKDQAQEQAQMKQLHGLLLSEAYDRKLAPGVQHRVAKVADTLSQLKGRFGPVIPSEEVL